MIQKQTMNSMKSLREHDGELIKHWYVLALEYEVPKKSPIRRYLYDQAFVLFRNTRGEVQVLADRCPHRGAQLSRGRIIDGNIVCPYHGWSMSGSGRLVNVPSNGPATSGNMSRNEKCVQAPPIVRQDGCVWIWPHESQPLASSPEWRFPYFGKTGVQSYFMITDFENETDHLVQNFMDVPHTVFVHSKWFRNRRLLQVPVEIVVGDGRVKVTYLQKNDSIGFTSYLLNPSGEEMVHTDEFIFPNITRVDYGFGKRFFVINSQCSPISRYQTRVFTWIAYDVGFVSSLLRPLMKFYTRKVIQQDVDIMKNQGDNLQFFERSMLAKAPWQSTQADELHIAIDKMRSSGRERLDEIPKMKFTKDREFWI